jgi:hypothetical protein
MRDHLAKLFSGHLRDRVSPVRPNLHLAGDVLSEDPLLCAPVACELVPSTEGNYALSPDSPALGNPCGPIGAFGAGCTVSVEETSWGRIKGAFR